MCPVGLTMSHHTRFVLVKYSNGLAYAFVEIVLEGYFEWAVFSSFEAYYVEQNWICRQAAASMLVAHWIFLIAGAMTLIADCNEAPKAE